MEELLLRESPSGLITLSYPLSDRQRVLINLHWDMAKFFFCFILKPNSLYEEFLVRSYQAKHEIEYSTLNYDNLLIQAVNRITQRFSGARFSVSFPHGNSSFLCEADINANGQVSAPANQAIEFNLTSYGHLQSNGPTKIVGSLSELLTRQQQGSLYPPVMCYINPSKYKISGANFIEEQQRKFYNQVRTAEQIVIIGVRVNENDAHIWQPLSRAQGKILFVSGKSAGEEFEGWKSSHSRSSDRHLPVYWKEAKDNVYEFLNGGQA